MIDITHKYPTLRKAIAKATVRVGQTETIQAILEGTVPKGDVFAMSKAAGLFAVKKTSDIIPDCHPMPIEYTGFHFETEGLNIHIEVEVHTIYKTGVEVEAMHGASVCALTMYDMLKPIDKNISIQQILLKEKKGGKSDFKKFIDQHRVDASVIVCSDSASAGHIEDQAGKAIMERLSGFQIPIIDYHIVPDEIAQIQDAAHKFSGQGRKLIIFIGGTGLSPRDLTPEALKPILDREIPGIAEAMRSYGQQRTPFAMLSRSICGLMQDSLVLALPGSVKGAVESIDALFPAILHIFRVMDSLRHEEM